MNTLFKSFKTEIMPTPEQKEIILRTIGVCRFVYNLYVGVNMERLEQGKPFMSGMTFSVWLNNAYLPANPEKLWIKQVSSKAVKRAIMNAENAYRRFFKGLSGFPRFKKKGKSDPSMYFVRNGAKQPIVCERHRMKIPTLGWVRLKEYGYLPINGSIKSGTVSVRAGRFFVSVLAEVPETEKQTPETDGIGVDLGIQAFATVSDERVFENINKTDEVGRLQKRLRREQRKLSRKYGSFQERNLKGGATRQNIQKQRLTVQQIYYRLDCIRTDFINKAIAELVKTKPSYIALEDLNVRGMMKNRHLAKAVSEQKFSEFRRKLTLKCAELGIELRVVDRFYPSSKTCHCCGRVKCDLKLSERVYSCECGYTADRDYNAALNLRDTERYKLA
ncbi:MAG: transposase [Oscillibacter sp.]|nr:transposase [Oscillibacter sp.]